VLSTQPIQTTIQPIQTTIQLTQTTNVIISPQNTTSTAQNSILLQNTTTILNIFNLTNQPIEITTGVTVTSNKI